MASTLYLIRRDQQWARYDAVTALDLTGSIQFRGSITGSQSTDIITMSGSTPVNGMQVWFTALTGGLGLILNAPYYVVSASGATFKVAASVGGAAINFTTEITAGAAILMADELHVWSGEFRDQFASTSASNENGESLGWANGFRQEGVTFVATGTSLVTQIVPRLSDEVNHVPLRQTWLNKTHWRFDRGGSAEPRYLYATWADGDIIADNPPGTDEDA